MCIRDRVLGVDGMDPSLTKKFMDEGKLPNIKKYVEKGACREDLVMLGAMPTITPPLWATLATGAYPETHGITCFWRQSKESLDEIVYAFDSIGCKAEQLWNVFAESGKKTLVWHWPCLLYTSCRFTLHIAASLCQGMPSSAISLAGAA